MNNSVLIGDLMIGGQPSPEAFRKLASDGYTTVINARGEGEIDWDEKGLLDSLGLQYVTIPMPGPVDEITDEQIDRFDEIMRMSDGPIVFHCGSGNRASGLWAAWLVEKKGIAPKEALDLAVLAGMTGVRPAVELRLGIEPGEL